MYGFVRCFTGYTPASMGVLASSITAAQAYSVRQPCSTLIDVQDPTVIGAFLDNQDLPRFNSLTSDKTLVYNAIVGAFLYGGIPSIYYGLEQDIADGPSDPANREALWQYNGYSTTASLTYGRIAMLNKIRSAIGKGDEAFGSSIATVVAIQDKDIALRRGGALIVLTNVRFRTYRFCL